MANRVDSVGVLLLALAISVAQWTYHDRAVAARWYAHVAEYNGAITRFLVDHRDGLAGRPVAVYGVSGLSPWSLSAGRYLARIVGDARWEVFVAQPDDFYPLGTWPGGSITVRAERDACEVASDPRTTHLVIAADGRGRIADDCRHALALAVPHPVIAIWGPQAITALERDAGFNMYFTGRDLVRGVEVRVAGRPAPMTYALHGALMTTAVPRQPDAGNTIPFVIVSRERVVFSANVAVK
jgi:hypothetical protein